MRINRINISCNQKSLLSLDSSSDYIFAFFKIPLVYQVDGTEQRLKSGTAILCRSNYLNSLNFIGDEKILFDSISFRPNSSEQQYISSLEIPLDKPFVLKEDVTIRNILKCIQNETFNYSKRRNEFVEYGMRMIFINICEQLGRENDNNNMKIPHYKELKLLRDNIYALPTNRWIIDDICTDLDISRTYFHRIYYAAFNVTFLQDVIDSRLACACDMLTNTELSVSNIAEKCGYDSDSYFMRQFKKNIGYTPSEYRRIFSDEKDDLYVNKRKSE